MKLRHSLAIVAVALSIIAMMVMAVSQDANAKAAVTLNQCATIPNVCDSSHSTQWQNGNLGQSQSRYFEDDSVPYRATFTGLDIGATYSVLIEWDSTQSGKHAIDTLTDFDRTIGAADPCAGVTCSGTQSTLPIPQDPNISAAGVSQTSGQAIHLFGGTFPAAGSVVANTGGLCAGASCTIQSNPSAYAMVGTFLGNSQMSTRVWFTADATTAVLAWGGHIASRSDWGNEHSATSISGSPYHMRLLDLTCSNRDNCSSGNMDRSLSSEAVIFPAAITVIEEATPQGSTVFDYTATPTPLANFTLVDDGSMSNTRVFDNITNFTSYAITVASEPNWTFTGANCQIASANGGSQLVAGSTATIDLREGELVTCTFTHNYPPSGELSLTKSADPGTYDSVGDLITYTYTITNSGQASVGPTQFTITDDRIGGGSTFNCGAPASTLDVGASLTCTAEYVIGQADIDADMVVNVAFASGGGLTSNAAEATVAYDPGATTTTSTSTTSTSTSTTTSTTSTSTTTTEPESTTTVVVESTTTTEDPTTTTVDSTTTVPGSTTTVVVESSTTTVEPTTTTVPESTTTVVAESSTTTVEPPVSTTSISPTTTNPDDVDELADTGNNADTMAALLIVMLGLGFALIVMRRSDI